MIEIGRNPIGGGGGTAGSVGGAGGCGDTGSIEITPLFDPVNKPEHYNSHPSGVQCIEVTRHMSFNLGNVIKYVWRADLKNGTQDLEKAAWYLADEIARRRKVRK